MEENTPNTAYTDKTEAIASHIEEIIRLLGEDVEREGLKKTPLRAAKALCDITSGYSLTPEQAVGDAFFKYDGQGMVIVRGIEFYSLCEHHLLPFFGHVNVGYVPGDKILGLSKLARIVDVYARRLQVQERLTSQIAHAVARLTDAEGVIVQVTAGHMCMKMRGVEKQDSMTTTTDFTGTFATDAHLRREFLELLNK